MQFWSGSVITSLQPNEVFVFGSNPEGRHGAGAAKAAVKFGARYGSGRGYFGQTYALVTKNLRAGYTEAASGITYPTEGYRSVSPQQISENIDELYAFAHKEPQLRFLVTYQLVKDRSGRPKRSLNGYDGVEMWNLFTDGKQVPENIVFHDSFAELAASSRSGDEPRIEILAHASSSYAPRTRENAGSADLTIAIAADFTTAGERLTKKAAGADFLSLPISDEPIVSARKLYVALKERGFLGSKRRPTLNVAGNGIYTLVKHGFDQAAANAHLFEIFQHLQPHLPLGKVISGGQTGIDFAGAVAGHAMGLDVRMTLPAGFLQRAADGVDRPQDPDDLRAQVIAQSEVLTSPASSEAD